MITKTTIRAEQQPITSKVVSVVEAHLNYLKKQNFQGWDVFDGLNSQLFEYSFLNRHAFARLAWIQFLKRFPYNLRSLLWVTPGDNPKAVGLFISGMLNLANYYDDNRYLKMARKLYDRLIPVKVERNGTLGWGYNFPWQARAFYVPAYKPNMVVSAFIGNALIDLYEHTDEEHWLYQSHKIAEFILQDLLLLEKEDELCLGYIPGEDAVVHNANLLGAAYLARLFSLSGKTLYQEKALKSVRFSVRAQRDDGAWVYGQKKHHQWVDNFHTGYNLVAIYRYQQYCQDPQFEESLIKGIDFHLKNHFTEDYLPRYSDVSLYPLDIHCFSQAIITPLVLKEYWPSAHINMPVSMIEHLLKSMYDEKRHYFYYQKTQNYTIKIPYIRWSQAWMFYALSFFLKNQTLLISEDL